MADWKHSAICDRCGATAHSNTLDFYVRLPLDELGASRDLCKTCRIDLSRTIAAWLKNPTNIEPKPTVWERLIKGWV